MRRLLFVPLFLLMVLPALAQTDPESGDSVFDNVNNLLDEIDNRVNPGNPTISIEEVAAGIITVALGLTSLVFIILIIYGGYTWGNARGNEEKVEMARKLIIESTIGLIIIFGAYFVTAFVVRQIGLATFTPFFYD